MGSAQGVIGGAASGASLGAAAGPWGAAIGGVVGGVAGFFGGSKKKKTDYDAILRDYQNYTPKSWWNDSDQAAMDLTRSRLAGSATESGRGARLLATRRMQARGLAGSPAQEATFARIAEGTAAGRQQAGEAAEGQKYNITLGREKMDFSRASQIFGARWGQAQQQDYLQSQQDASFWNSLTGFAGDAMLAYGGGDGGGGGNQVDSFDYADPDNEEFIR